MVAYDGCCWCWGRGICVNESVEEGSIVGRDLVKVVAVRRIEAVRLIVS